MLVPGCGKKGDPVPPDRPIPPRLAEFTIERTGSAVTLRFLVPQPEVESDAPSRPTVERVDVFAVSRAAGTAAPTLVELMVPAHLITSVRPPLPAPSPTPATPSAAAPGQKGTDRPAWDGTLTFVETLPAPTPETAVRYYVAMAAAGRRKGPPSPMLQLAASTALPLPSGVRADYTEKTLTLTWVAPAADQRFFVEETDQAGAHPKRLTTTVLNQPTFELPVEFGHARCFIVRAADRQGAVTTLGEATAPVCVTPTDHFPPQPAAGLSAVPGDGAIELLWNASPSSDVAGYVVLRSEGANGTLQPLMTAPIAVTSYRDETARSGVTYDYAVKAVDKAGNGSELSNRQTVTARQRERESVSGVWGQSPRD